jgi:cytidylate kinase
MTSPTNTAIVDQRVELMRRYWRKRHEAPQANSRQAANEPKMVIAVNREAGSGGLEIAQEAGRRLDWPVYDREILEMVAQKAGLRAELVESVDEHDPNWLVEALSSIGRTQIHSAAFVHHLVSVIGSLGAKDNCIIVGRGASAILNPNSTLSVRIIADFDDRVARTMKQKHLTKAEAEALVRTIDQDRQQFFTNHFHQDVTDPHNCDVTLNTSRVSIDSCVAVLVDSAKRWQRQLAAEPA